MTEIGPGLLEQLEEQLGEREDSYRFEDGDHERFSHYVKKEDILASAVTGNPVRALCGKVWVPSRDPDRFPTCPLCKEIFDSLPRE